MKLNKIFSTRISDRIGQCRAVPVRYRAGEPEGILTLTSAVFDVDPYVEMFFFPTDTLTMTLFSPDGRVVWKRDLGRGVVPGMWFCPAYPFDLDSDGVEEIWTVTNSDEDHPFAVSKYQLERIDAASGETTATFPWPHKSGTSQPLSSTFRNFLLGGRIGDTSVLVTAQGTYGDMHLQAWTEGMKPLWSTTIAEGDPGARGSHMSPVVDINEDGTDEIFWGERCLSMANGSELFCGDRETYRGHSDIIQPVYDWSNRTWTVYTCREGDPEASPRVVTYDSEGKRIWGKLNEGHIDMGWIARVGKGGKPLAMAARIGKKQCGPDGREYSHLEEFFFEPGSGNNVQSPFDAYKTIPVDLEGSGRHVLVRGLPGGNGDVIDKEGRILANVGGAVALACNMGSQYPGEQMLSYSPDGILSLWTDEHAKEQENGRKRYKHRFYKASRKLTATGSNLMLLGGI